ncbi:hypothetical protein K491DRAFT_692217 [Lophiostoma macrostomum CBS 122681]|uniref:A to I editase domain-containing protein n=1 Tax=Lophiostoma macrostomum CBS 122681 TaxID=1314788 RepID=A0A6A6TBE3_9PLEO|nr:hypothetical protein K491DRAFT_692217 [Lophiostoma macrostomum CBS 122681]
MDSARRYCFSQKEDGVLSCVSLGTGMKCIPFSKLPDAHGNILHDWHAEILALRAFNRFLLDECLELVSCPSKPSDFLDLHGESTLPSAIHQPYKLKDDVSIHMYCSEAPCGDCSMELTMDAQEDATPWTSPPPTVSSPVAVSDTSTVSTSAAISALRGRTHFSHLGAVRMKPSRPDAPPTLSKSCTDKMALSQCTSLLSSLTSLLIHPGNCYLSTLIIPRSQFVSSACTRAFSSSGRMSGLANEIQGKWSGGYSFKGFRVMTTDREFVHSRRSVLSTEKAISCNLSAVYTPHFQESLIGGVLQGRKQFDPRGASLLSRRNMWKAVVQIVGMLSALGVKRLGEASPDLAAGKSIELGDGAYRDIKGSEALRDRRRVKSDVQQILKGWVKNSGDDEFSLDDFSSLGKLTSS